LVLNCSVPFTVLQICSYVFSFTLIYIIYITQIMYKTYRASEREREERVRRQIIKNHFELHA